MGEPKKSHPSWIYIIAEKAQTKQLIPHMFLISVTMEKYHSFPDCQQQGLLAPIMETKASV